MSTGPTIKRGKSSGDIWTPKPFLAAVEYRFGRIAADLACTTTNMVVPKGLCADEGIDALQINWAQYLAGGLGWLNPPYADIATWAQKCAVESQRGAHILLLVPASVGANWYWNWVDPYAAVYSIGRLVFDNCYNAAGRLVTTPYPKDLILCYYNAAYAHLPLQRWLWRAIPFDMPTTTMLKFADTTPKGPSLIHEQENL